LSERKKREIRALAASSHEALVALVKHNEEGNERRRKRIAVASSKARGSPPRKKVPTLKEAFGQKKFAKLTFKKFEEMTSEVLSPS